MIKIHAAPMLLFSTPEPDSLRWASIQVKKRKYPEWSHLTRKTLESQRFQGFVMSLDPYGFYE